eukprot:CAMPEP_0198297354 /NCGR_PEP_ID=MMETSP1449-20131203/36589_1 /TAXON_ID=420275 /ORGANISM="Attheya septentrionalis, Strain CCMP2084" /LENGTH=50 /DNA_ID=CAMNT_0043998255 /DNA_START=175 /DNA_END=323 /DNA_ORIENTATION=-
MTGDTAARGVEDATKQHSNVVCEWRWYCSDGRILAPHHPTTRRDATRRDA